MISIVDTPTNISGMRKLTFNEWYPRSSVKSFYLPSYWLFNLLTNTTPEQAQTIQACSGVCFTQSLLTSTIMNQTTSLLLSLYFQSSFLSSVRHAFFTSSLFLGNITESTSAIKTSTPRMMYTTCSDAFNDKMTCWPVSVIP